MAKKSISAGEERAAREHKERLERAKKRVKHESISIERAYSREVLIESLESDFTGHLQLATLTFDQTVQWSIAKSLQVIAQVLNERDIRKP
jgi:hypothetical protein